MATTKQETDKYVEEMTKIPGEINLERFLSSTLNSSVEKVLPTIVALLDKKLRKFQISTKHKLTHEMTTGAAGFHLQGLARLKASVESQELQDHLLRPHKVAANRSAGSHERERSSTNEKKPTGRKIRFQTFHEKLGKMENKSIEEIEESESEDKFANLSQLDKKDDWKKDNIKLQNYCSSSSQDSSPEENELIKVQSRSYPRSGSNYSGQSHLHMYNDFDQKQTVKTKKQRELNALKEEIRPLFDNLINVLCVDLNKTYPFLPSVLFQLLEMQDQTVELKSLLEGTKMKLNKETDPYFQITLNPIDSRHITAYNKQLLEENLAHKAKIEDQADQIRLMRRNYNRELNNQVSQEQAAKKRLAKLEKAGLFQMQGDNFDFQSIKFFDVTDGLDPDLLEMLNFKVKAIKDKFTDWQARQLEHVTALSKKIHMYESLSKDFHGIVSMSLPDIFQGVRLMDEPPEKVWDAMVGHFGHEFFLPTISKNYGHLFVNDTKRHQDKLSQAIEDTLENEKLLFKQCSEQVRSMKNQLTAGENELTDQYLRNAAEVNQAGKTGMQLGIDKATLELQDQVSAAKEDLARQVNKNEGMQLVLKDSVDVIRRNQLRSAWTCFVLNGWAKKDKKLSVRYINGVRHTDYDKTYHEFEMAQAEMKKKEIQLMCETNAIKRRWVHLIAERDGFESDNQLVQAKVTRLQNLVDQHREQFSVQSTEITSLQRNLETQTQLLEQVTQERDRIYRQTNTVPLAASKIDNIFKTAKCIITYNGWKNLHDLKKVQINLREKLLTTDLKGTWKSFEVVEKAKLPQDPSDEALAKISVLPSVETAMQTDTEAFEAYMEEAFPGVKAARRGLRESAGTGTSVGVSCAILDAEQVNCFIWDSLCNDNYLAKLIEHKRKYEGRLDYGKLDLDQLGNGSHDAGLGGMVMLDGVRKLPEGLRLAMRGKIGGLQKQLEVEKYTGKWPKLKGVYERLWEDAGLKGERMDQLRGQIDQMLQEELMKKILLHKNKSSRLLVKNSLLLSGFLEQIRHFIGKSIYAQEMQQQAEVARDFVLEGHNHGAVISPIKRNQSPVSHESGGQPLGVSAGGAQERPRMSRSRERPPDDRELIRTAKEFMEKLRQIIKHKKTKIKSENRFGPFRERSSPSLDDISGQKRMDQNRFMFSVGLGSGAKDKPTKVGHSPPLRFVDQRHGYGRSPHDDHRATSFKDSPRTQQMASANRERELVRMATPQQYAYAELADSAAVRERENLTYTSSVLIARHTQSQQLGPRLQGSGLTADMQDASLPLDGSFQGVPNVQTLTSLPPHQSMLLAKRESIEQGSSLGKQLSRFGHHVAGAADRVKRLEWREGLGIEGGLGSDDLPPSSRDQMNSPDAHRDLQIVNEAEGLQRARSMAMNRDGPYDEGKKEPKEASGAAQLSEEKNQRSKRNPPPEETLPMAIRDFLRDDSEGFAPPELVFPDRPSSAAYRGRGQIFSQNISDHWKFKMREPHEMLQRGQSALAREKGVFMRSKHVKLREGILERPNSGNMNSQSHGKLRLAKGRQTRKQPRLRQELTCKQQLGVGGGGSNFFTSNQNTIASNAGLQQQNLSAFKKKGSYGPAAKRQLGPFRARKSLKNEELAARASLNFATVHGIPASNSRPNRVQLESRNLKLINFTTDCSQNQLQNSGQRSISAGKMQAAAQRGYPNQGQQRPGGLQQSSSHYGILHSHGELASHGSPAINQIDRSDGIQNRGTYSVKQPASRIVSASQIQHKQFNRMSSGFASSTTINRAGKNLKQGDLLYSNEFSISLQDANQQELPPHNHIYNSVGIHAVASSTNISKSASVENKNLELQRRLVAKQRIASSKGPRTESKKFRHKIPISDKESIVDNQEAQLKKQKSMVSSMHL